MTNLSSVCPGCASPIENIDKFCQDCGLSLVVSLTQLRSPLLGKRTPSRAISRAASRGVNRVDVDGSPKVWVRGLVGAETLLLLAMFAYSGYAMFWVEKSTPELVRFQTNQKKPSHASQEKSIIAQVPETLSQEIAELITQAKLLSHLRLANPEAAVAVAMKARHHHTSAVEASNSVSATTSGASPLMDDRSGHANPRVIAVRDFSASTASSTTSGTSTSSTNSAISRTSATNGSAEKSPEEAAQSPEVRQVDRDVESTAQAKAALQAKLTGEGKFPRPIAGRELSDVAEYNKLLAGYFSRHHEDSKGANQPGASSEPPSYQEWVDSSKQIF